MSNGLLRLRCMRPGHFATIQEIENESFEFPWSPEEFEKILREKNCFGIVAVEDEKVLGYAIFLIYRSRLHILSFAVHPRCRLEGVGAAMVGRLKNRLSSQRRTRILLEVRETNLAAQMFFRKQGFRAVSVLRDYYEDTTEDAYVMQHRYQPRTSLPV